MTITSDDKQNLLNIENQVCPAISKKLIPGNLLTLRTKGKRTELLLYHIPGRVPKATIVRNHTGIIETTGLDHNSAHRACNTISHQLNQVGLELRHQIVMLILKEARRSISNHAIDQLTADPRHNFTKFINQKAGQLVLSQFATAKVFDRSIDIQSQKHGSKLIDRTVRENILDPQIFQLTQDVYRLNNYAPSRFEYNNIAAYQDALLPIHQQTPAVAQLWTMIISQHEQQTSNAELPTSMDNFHNPARIVAACQQIFQWSPRQWHYFTALPQCPYISSLTNTGHLTVAIDMLIATNTPRQRLKQDDRLVHFLTSGHTQYLLHNLVESSSHQGNVHELFVQIIKTCLVQNQTNAHDLKHIFTAFRYHVDNQIHWSKTDQPGYLARAVRHQRNTAKRLQTAV